MIPTKKALRPMKSPARPTKQVTFESALETGLRNAITAAPPMSMMVEKSQKI
jgi:hypothetical protein